MILNGQVDCLVKTPFADERPERFTHRRISRRAEGRSSSYGSEPPAARVHEQHTRPRARCLSKASGNPLGRFQPHLGCELEPVNRGEEAGPMVTWAIRGKLCVRGINTTSVLVY